MTVLPRRLLESLDEKRLRNLLAAFFTALAIPTGVLIWQAYSQLKWEALHEYQQDAEELTQRIDARLGELMRAADARSFADYAFLVVSGDPSANFVQRSPLSSYPVEAEIPGALGYFQVNAAGEFSTPLLPPEGTAADSLGVGAAEYGQRLVLARELQAILADNRLVQVPAEPGRQRAVRSYRDALEAAPQEQNRAQQEASPAASASLDVDAGGTFEDSSAERLALDPENYSQRVFDRLNEARRDLGVESAGGPSPAANLQPERDDGLAEPEAKDVTADKMEALAGRSKRKEQSALPESVAAPDALRVANISGLSDLRISTFESEIDAFEFSLLDSGHFVLFRRVWRDGERYIQGLLLDREAFAADTIGASFMDTSLSGMASLGVAYRDHVLQTFGRTERRSFPNVADELDGTLLYRSRLGAPLNSLELIFSIRRLPPGPGASVLGWVTLVLAAVFVGGFVTLYRTGSSQIALARKQQDFVSAVSHELKSPLTSIRMYGEMLKEGWASDEKRQGYYEYIHDEADRLSRLISNVLQLAQITRNEPQFVLKPTRVGELMADTEAKISSQVERAGFELRLDVDEAAERETIDVDPDCFAQIVINLVDNAIKFSRNADNKIIDIRGRRTADDRILFSVRDYGPGIPRDQMKKIFEMFYRSESELTRETVGTGIGLAIVHQLTVAMAGDVDLANAGPGAEFRVRFPVVTAE